MNPNEIWQAALGELELTLSKANFTTWFKNTFISTFENAKIIIAVPNTFTKAWLEKKYHEAIVRSLRNATNNGVREVTYRVEVRNTSPIPGFSSAESMESSYPVPTLEEPSLEQKEGKSEGLGSIGLNPRYTFESFVVGKTNELAHASAQAVSASPGVTYNPLFIFGGAGLGKTHLLQAIGHHVLKEKPNAKVLYVTCERFTNDFIQSVRGGRGKEFKDTYRNLDVLLLDDIQFIAGKDSTQEEFFNTFNTLHQLNKQIVITSDRPAKDIQGLETRIVSRVEWGMTADISSPDFETRVAILQGKSNEKNYRLSMDILRYIAGTIQSNVRELEGALNKVIAYHQFKSAEPTMESVQNLLQSFVPNIPKRTITPRKLLEIVVSYYDIKMEELLGKSREQRLAFPRQVAMYLLREEAKCSFPAIGKQIGSRDHTTAMHACNKISELLKKDEQLQRDLNLMREKLYMGTQNA
ncbi:MAG: chromosomal replication initiator protein DnaA [Patescibacteria group bacterium]|nr:chromosomal replication initiator protein DnaA [Patescibacteria group bacterium]